VRQSPGENHRAAATAKEIALSIPPRSYVKEYLPPCRAPLSPRPKVPAVSPFYANPRDP